MTEIGQFDQLIAILREGGTIAALLGLLVAIWKKILVPGWAYDLCMTRMDKLEEKLDKRVCDTRS